MEYQVHLLAFGVLLSSVVLAWKSPGSYGVQQTLMLISSLGFAAGFSVWCWPTVKKVWAHPVGKTAIATFHVFVLFLSTAFARSVVASSLGLPPQDFDMTVAAISLASYIPAWSLVISLVLGVTAVTLEIAGFFAMLARHSFGTVAKLFARMFGAIAICAISGDICGFAMKNETLLHPAARWIAYFCDFQPAARYPGIAEGERIRLHENGVISVAEIQGGEIRIQVRKYEQ
uniref:Uncharacterized protein n=1 Tax=Curvibacter symbiont subsp. Hydra magnipapillata TaxID=667019 RepID=C9YBX0_CURXX|nr:hypothetical protein Csp_C21990 [Curvibacter putative symbiont of Hydra magnipapillata]